MSPRIKKILVIRNDKIGDFMLIWPALSYLKKNLPQSQITCVVSKSVKELALNCAYIDEVVVDSTVSKLKEQFKKDKFDVAVSFFSTFRIGYLLYSLKIPIRIAPKTKLAQFFYNYKILQRRSRSEKPEHEYNTDLIIKLFEIIKLSEPSEIELPPYLILDNEESKHKRIKFFDEYQINSEKKIIFIHPGTGGSSKNLSLDVYSRLCQGLRKFDDYNFLIHGSNDEQEMARSLKLLLASTVKIKVITPTQKMSEVIFNINNCDIFISGSTGPLHIAGALNKKTIAFYPSKRSSTSLRWQTINDFGKRLDFSDNNNKNINISINEKKSIIDIQKFIGS